MAAKKKSKKNLDLFWRPSFRQVEELPDTKVIRTDFLLNFVAISVSVALLFLIVFKEYNSYSLESALTNLERQIESNQEDNRRYLTLNGRFKKAEKVLDQVVNFTKQPVAVSDFMMMIPEIRPDSLIISNISLRPVVVTQGRRVTIDYRISISGTLSDQAEPSPTQVITEFQSDISEAEIVSPYFKDIALSRFIRDNALNIFNFTIEVSLNPDPKKP